MPGAIQHLFLAKRERLLALNQEQSFENLRHFKQRAVPHLIRIFFETVLPILATMASPFGQELEHSAYFPVARDLAQPHLADMRERDHDGQVIATETQQVVP